jgi:hypothetical protein
LFHRPIDSRFRPTAGLISVTHPLKRKFPLCRMDYSLESLEKSDISANLASQGVCEEADKSLFNAAHISHLSCISIDYH